MGISQMPKPELGEAGEFSEGSSRVDAAEERYKENEQRMTELQEQITELKREALHLMDLKKTAQGLAPEENEQLDSTREQIAKLVEEGRSLDRENDELYVKMHGDRLDTIEPREKREFNSGI